MGQPTEASKLRPDASGALPVAVTVEQSQVTGLPASLLRTKTGLSRILAKLATGQDVKITFIGDSGFEGSTATTPGTDDCASLVCSTLASRYGVTVTKSNMAISGHTVAYGMCIILTGTGQTKTQYQRALDDNADLYVISYGHNDIRSDLSTPGTGYPRESSMGGMEYMIRRIRTERPWADVMLSTEWPYNTTSSGSNVPLILYNKAMRRLAAAYGCEFADCYQAFVDQGNYQPLIDATNHPNSAGHALWAATILARFPAVGDVIPHAPQDRAALGATTLHGAERYMQTPWTRVTTANAGVGVGASMFKLTGTWAGTSPYTSTTAGDKIIVTAKASELLLRLDCGSGQGVVKINVGNVTLATVDLSTYPTGQGLIPVVGLPMGLTACTIYVVSGSVTFRGVDCLNAPCEWFDPSAGRVTLTGTWDTFTSSAMWNNTQTTTSTTGDSLAFEFVGTGCGLLMLRYSNAVTRALTVTVDGGSSFTIESKGTDSSILSEPGGVVLVSGLEYGRHTVTVTRPGNGPVNFQIYSIFAFDESRLARPRRQAGIANAGEAVKFGAAFAGKPCVRVSASGSGTTPVYPSGGSATGFTVGGTSGDPAIWEAEGSTPIAF